LGSARNGEIPKFQKPLFGTTPPSALSGLVVQTFLRGEETMLSKAWSIVALTVASLEMWHNAWRQRDIAEKW
ncbi:hypothetical protein, partial [Xanthomonas citri]|uniref:hypothetical protein n=1 Tax=Xanthomonas citri TaxID=346 RepID=UPI001040D4D3